METMTAGARRTRPPLPRPAADGDTRPPLPHRPPVPAAARPAPPPPRPADDPGQAFVAALRAAAAGFAVAAGVATAVVAEAVPPARHRQARCRVALLAADGTGRDVTFVGAAGRPTAAAVAAFTGGIAGWLAAAGPTPGPDAPVDVTAESADR
jgi:hypothetical protein